MYEVVAVAGPDDVKGLLGQVAPGSADRKSSTPPRPGETCGSIAT
jgi:hypothetical protein